LGIRGKRHRLNAIAIGINDESRVVTHPIVRPQTRSTIGQASGIQRGRVECIDLVCRFRSKADVCAAAGRYLGHIGAMIDPELGIALA